MISQLYQNNYRDNPANAAIIVIGSIHSRTSIKVFKQLCEENPTFNVESDSYNSYTALIKAIDSGNFNLAEHIVTNSSNKKELLETYTSRGSPLIKSIFKLDISFITFLIKSGADVNNPYLSIDEDKFDEFNSSLVNLALDAIKCPTTRRRMNATNFTNDPQDEIKTKIVKILLQNGALPCVNFTKKGKDILNEASRTENFCLKVLTGIKDINNFFSIDSFKEDRIPLIEARRQIYNENHLMLNSNVSKSATNTVIFPNEQNKIVDKAKQIINSAIKKICQNETLFLSAFLDGNSSISSLPKDVIDLIVAKRISIDL